MLTRRLRQTLFEIFVELGVASAFAENASLIQKRLVRRNLIRQRFPGARPQSCWVRKTAHVLDKLAKKLQSEAKSRSTRSTSPCRRGIRRLLELYKATHPKACDCLTKDREVLITFYDFPRLVKMAPAGERPED